MTPHDDEYRVIRARLEPVVATRDLDAVHAALQVSPQRERLSPHAALGACDALAGRDLGDFRRQAALLHDLAGRGLAGEDTRSDVEVGLVLHLQASATTLGLTTRSEEWPELRRRAMDATLTAWRRLHGSMDASFGPDDAPLLNVIPPDELGIRPGTAPEAVLDPVLRERYDEALAQNANKAECYAEHLRIRELRQMLNRATQDFIIHAYSIGSSDDKGLEQAMTMLTSEEGRAIRAAVARRSPGSA